MKNIISQTVPYQVDTAYSPFKAGEFGEALEFLASEGFTGVEIAVAFPGEANPDALLSVLERSNLTATTLSTGQICGLRGLYLSSPDDDVRTAAINTVKEHIDLSSRIGKPHVTIGYLRGTMLEGDKAKLTEAFRQALLPCFEHGAKRGVIIQIEPINHAETLLINTVAEAMDLISSLGNPENAGILYDTYHSDIEDGGMANAMRAAGSRITNIHISDSNRGLPGQGRIDFSIIREVSGEIGYKGAFALETLTIPDAEHVRANCHRAIACAIG